MRLRNLIFVLPLVLVLKAYGQASYEIKGKVLDENDVPLPYVNAALFNPDSSLVAGGVSDDAGIFSIAAKDGQYSLRVSFLSYEEQVLPVSVNGSDFDLGTIHLKPSQQILEAVTVEGERSQTDLHLDKRVFQVGKDLSNISANATDILDNVPAVTVDVDGNVFLRGSQNVRILIDGRPSGMTGINTADALRQLQGNLIESIEVITNPSSRYDAEGEVGIINIILKKEKAKGINGSFSANAGYPENYGASFNINARRKNLNFFSSYGFNYRSSPGGGSSFQSFITNDTSFSYQQNSTVQRGDKSHNIRAGLDLYLTEKSILTTSFILRKSDGINTAQIQYDDFDSDGVLRRTIIRNEREQEPELNTEIAMSYKKDYDRKGQSLTADLKWIENREIEKSVYDQTDFSIDSTGHQRSSNTENERNALAQIDYIHPFSAKGKIEGGLKGTMRVIDNDFQVEQFDPETEEWSTLPQFNNNLIYTENIYAGYFIVSNEHNKFAWQAGLRGELSDISVELTETEEITYQNYFNLFPSVHLSYKLTDNKTLQLSYSYRISRPDFRDLAPFSSYSDNRSVFVGNPNLRPEYTRSLEAGYLLNWQSGSILSTAYYRYTTGVVERIALVDSIGFTRMLPVNLAASNSYGLELTISWNPTNWWRLNSNANFFRAITDGSYEDMDFYSDTHSWTNRTTSRISFLKRWDFQAGFNYRSARITTQGRFEPMYFVDLGLSRDLFKGNGTLTLSVRDLFNTRRFRNVVDRPDEGYYMERDFQGEGDNLC